MKTAGRFKACRHMGCFDIATFVGLLECSKKIQSCGEEITEIDVKPDGFWRVKNASDAGDLAQWHHPDGSIQFISKQDTAEQYVVPNINEPEISSVQLNFSQAYEVEYQNPNLPYACPDVIIISDSEDDFRLASSTIPAVPHYHERCSVSAAVLDLNSHPIVGSDEDLVVINGTADHPHNNTVDNQSPSEKGKNDVLIPSPSISRYELPNLNDSPGEDWLTLKTGANVDESSRSNVEAHREYASESGMDMFLV